MFYEYIVRFIFNSGHFASSVLTNIEADAYGMPKDEDAVIKAAIEQCERENGFTLPIGKPCIEIDFTLIDIIDE